MKHFKQINKIISYLVVSTVVFNLFLFGVLINKSLPQNDIKVRANGVPSSSMTIQNQPFIGQNFDFTINFSNSSITDVGYGPYVNLYLPSNGIDGDNGNDVQDGITFNSASFLNTSVDSIQFTFPDDDGNGPLTTGCIEHPYARNTDNTPYLTCGQAGDTLVVLTLPFGSFTPDQPTASILVSANLSNLADLNQSLLIEAEAGFYLGGDALNNPSVDPSILELTRSNLVINSQLINVNKSVLFPEAETVTGPNFVREFQISTSIADGQVIEDYVITDDFPNDLVYQGITNISSGCSVVSEPIMTAPTNNAKIIVSCGTVTGGNTYGFDYAFYGADIDADGNNVIDHNIGGSKTTQNQVASSGLWNPIDTRDGAVLNINSAPDSVEVILRSNAIQKSVSISNDVGNSGLTPGDTLTYNIRGQISDFFAFENLVISDIISDGQRITSSIPNVTFNFGTTTSTGSIDSTNLSIIDHYTGATNPVSPIDGTTEIIMNLSDELSLRGLGDKFIGGCLLNGINPSQNPNCDIINNGPTTFEISFSTIVQDKFSDDYPSGEPTVNSRDNINNNISQSLILLDNTNTNNSYGITNSDQSSSSIIVVGTNISKSIYAVNGVIGVPSEIYSGDEITYRIFVQLPTSDAEDLVIDDFLPLPTFNVNELNTTINNYSGSVPIAGTSSFGPNDTTFAINGIYPTITKNPVSNQISYNYGTFDDVLNRSSNIEILFTVTITDKPSEDNLKLTNQARLLDSSTNGGSAVANQIIQVNLRKPRINMNKGIVGALSNNTVYSPSQVSPIGVNFNQPNTSSCQSFSGTIGSDKLSQNHINSDISGGVDGGDIIRYAVIVENTGGSNAYDLTLNDIIPSGLQIPSTGSNLCVTRGDGTVLSYSSVNNSNTNPFFEDGIIINDTQADPSLKLKNNNVIDNSTNGENIVVITYDLQINNNIFLDSTLINRTNILNFASVDGGSNLAGDQFDTASVEILHTPQINKNVANINYPGTNNTQVVIGSIVNYKSSIILDEGLLSNVKITDTLDTGLAFVKINSITYSSPDITSDIPLSTVLANVNGSSGGFTLDFGNITNSNVDNNQVETIEIDYDVVVLSTPSNTAGVDRNNNIRIDFRDRSNNVLSQSAEASNVRIIEPALGIVKDISPAFGDNNDQFVVTLDISHTSTSSSNAFDVSLTDILPQGMDFIGPILNPTGVAPSSFSNTGNTVNVSYSSINLGESSRITFLVQLNQTVSPNQLITNTANINWSSLSGNISSSQSSYSPLGVERNYNANGNDTVRVNNITLNKSIIDTNINNLDFYGSPSTTGNNLAIGEHVQYEVIMNIPEGTADNLVLTDFLDPGLVFVGIDSISASPSLSTSISGGFNGVVNNAIYSGTGRTMTLNFGTVINSDVINGNVESIVIRYTAGVPNTIDATDNVLANNSVNLTWGTGSVTASAPNITIVEPNLIINKTVDKTEADNQDVLNYTIEISNIGTATSFDNKLIDAIPIDIDYIPNSITVNSSNTNSIDVTNLPNLSVTFDQIDVNETVTIYYQALVSNNIYPSQYITNIASISGSSLNGDQFSSSSSQVTDNVRERTGDITDFGGTLNNYSDNINVSFRVPPVSLSKTIATTSDNDSGVNVSGSQNVHIGEIVRYRLVSIVPESYIPNINITDNLPLGLEFINDGSANIAFVSNNLMESSNFSGGSVISSNGNITPTFSIPNSAITVSSNSVNFELGNVLNSDNDADSEFIIIEFNTIVKNILQNQDNVTIPNSFVFNYLLESYTSPADISSTVNIIEPQISTTKTLNQTPNDQGDPVSYSINLNNTGTAYGYNLRLTDLVDSNITIQSVTGSSTFIDNTLGQLIDVTVKELAPNSSFTLEITGILNSSSTGQKISNTANTVYESLSDDSKANNSTNSININPLGSENGPRNGSIGANTTDLNNYFSTDDIDFVVNSATIEKLSPTKTSYAIGEYIDYDIKVNLPEGESINTRIIDQVPNGLIYDSHSILTTVISSSLLTQDFSGNIPSNIVSGGNNSGEDLTIEFGNINTNGDNNGLNNSFVVRIRFLVNNEIGNQNGTIFTNIADLLIDTNVGDTITVSDTANNVNIIEPELMIEKTIDDNTPTFGQQVEYTITINHSTDSTANAYDVVLSDLIPSQVDYVLGSSILESGWTVDESDLNNILFFKDQINLGQTSVIKFSAVLKNNNILSLNQNIINTANIRYTSILGDDVNERNGSDTITGLNNYTAQDNVSALVSSPDLVINKDNNKGVVTAGELVLYTINISNQGNNTSNNIVVTETVPNNTTFNLSASTSGWSCSDLATPGTQCQFNITSLDPSQNQNIIFAINIDNSIPSGVTGIFNQASVSDDLTGGIEPNLSNNVDTDNDVLDASPNLSITKTDNQTSVNPSEVLNYTITVSNIGNQDADNVIITENIPLHTTHVVTSAPSNWDCSLAPQCTLAISSLVVGESKVFQFSVKVDDNLPTGANEITNQVSVQDDGANGVDQDLANNSFTDINELNASPDLIITKTPQQSNFQTGQDIRYQISYSNEGNQDAQNVIIKEVVPLNTRFNESESTSGFSCSDNSPENTICLFELPSLNVGTNGTINFTVTIDTTLEAGVEIITNTVQITDDGTNGIDQNLENNVFQSEVDVLAQPELSITKNDSLTQVVPGQVYTYQLTVTNQGDQEATGVVVTDQFPTNLTYINSNDHNNNQGVYSNGTVTFNPTNILSGQTLIYTVTFQVNLPALTGDVSVTNTARVQDDGTNGIDPDLSNNINTDQNELIAVPDLEIRKSDRGITLAPDQIIIYDIVANNIGNQNASNVVITETVPLYSVFDSLNSSAGWICIMNSCTYQISELNVSQPQTIQFAVKVDTSLPSLVEEIRNIVKIQDDGTNGVDPDLDNNEFTEITSINATPNLSITKTDNLSIAVPGQTIEYDITISNTGNQEATGIIVTENIPIGSTFDSSNSTIGWNCDINICTYGITSLKSGEELLLKFSVIINNPLSAGINLLVNTITVAEDGNNGVEENMQDNSYTDQTIINASPDIKITKTDNLESIEPNDQIIYTLTIENVGNQHATGVLVKDTLPEYLTYTGTEGSLVNGEIVFPQFDLNVGQIVEITVPVSVDIDQKVPAGLESVTNIAIANDDGQNGVDTDLSNNTSLDTNLVTAKPDLSIKKTNNFSTVSPSDVITYDIIGRNDGDQNASNVVITETVPQNTTFNQSLSSPLWICQNGGISLDTCTYSHSLLEAGDQINLQFVVNVDPNIFVNEITNLVTITDDETGGIDPTPENNTYVLSNKTIGDVDLEVTKANGLENVEPGEVVEYTLKVKNNGNILSNNIQLIDTIDENTTYVSSSDYNQESGLFDPNNSTLTFNLFSLNPAEEKEFIVKVTINDVAPAGIELIRNKVTVNDDKVNGIDINPDNDTAFDIDNLIANPDLKITIETETTLALPNTEIEFTLNYSNIGNQNSTGVYITQYIPKFTKLSQKSLDLGWVCEGSSLDDYIEGVKCTYFVDKLNVNDSGNINLYLTLLDQDELDYNTPLIIENVSIADDQLNGNDPTPNNNLSGLDIKIPFADLEIEKTVDQLVSQQNQVLTYKFVFRNKGVDDATDVVMTDILPDNLEFIEATRGGNVIPVLQENQKLTLFIGELKSNVEDFVLIKTRVINDIDIEIVNEVTLFANEADPEISNNRSQAVTLNKKIIISTNNNNPFNQILSRTGGVLNIINIIFTFIFLTINFIIGIKIYKKR